jgi:programmed cell death 6-interacting protein
MNLPSSLDVLSQPIGLPPSLLRKAAQVRREDGPARMSKMVDDIPKLAARCRAFVDEVDVSPSDIAYLRTN